jgi:hypothetical protein
MEDVRSQLSQLESDVAVKLSSRGSPPPAAGAAGARAELRSLEEAVANKVRGGERGSVRTLRQLEADALAKAGKVVLSRGSTMASGQQPLGASACLTEVDRVEAKIFENIIINDMEDAASEDNGGPKRTTSFLSERGVDHIPPDVELAIGDKAAAGEGGLAVALPVDEDDEGAKGGGCCY